MIYKIFRSAEMAAFVAEGRTMGAPVDHTDGFVHFSDADQLAGTAARHFAGEDELWLVACDAETMGPALRWEPSRGGARFPHLYRMLEREDVAWARPLLKRDGAHVFASGPR